MLGGRGTPVPLATTFALSPAGKVILIRATMQRVALVPVARIDRPARRDGHY